MSTVEILLGAVEPIGVRLRRGPTLVTGATVRARVLRTSDGFELDWSTNTFVLAGTAVQPRQVLTEAPASSGAYEYAWDTGSVANPTTPDTYLVEFDETAPTVRTFIRQSEVRVRAAQSVSAAVAGVQADTNDLQARLPAALVGGRVDASVGAMQADTINSNAVAASAAVEMAAAVWDEPLASHATPGTAGYVLTSIAADSTPAAIASAVWSEPVPGVYTAGMAGFVLERIRGFTSDLTLAALTAADDAAAAVWATPEGLSSTMGRSLGVLRQRCTNRRVLAADGTMTFYSDDGFPLVSVTLTDVNGGPIVVVPGDPAQSTAEG